MQMPHLPPLKGRWILRSKRRRGLLVKIFYKSMVSRKIRNSLSHYVTAIRLPLEGAVEQSETEGVNKGAKTTNYSLFAKNHVYFIHYPNRKQRNQRGTIPAQKQEARFSPSNKCR